MTLLSQAFAEIARALSYQPKLNARMCWRFHTDDLLVIMEEAKQYATEREQPWMPLGDFYLAGVRVFGDDSAPRLERPA